MSHSFLVWLLRGLSLCVDCADFDDVFIFIFRVIMDQVKFDGNYAVNGCNDVKQAVAQVVDEMLLQPR